MADSDDDSHFIEIEIDSDVPRGRIVVPKGRRRLQEVLNLNNKAWKKWLRSPIVKLSWVELWNSCLKDIEVESKEYKRGQNLAAIKRRILLGEVGGRRKYSAPYREKDGWGEAEHLACFLFWVKYENEVDRDGMFFYKPWMPDNQKYAIVWGLLNWIREIHSPSRISLPGGGTAIFGTKRDNAEDNVVTSGTGETPHKKVLDFEP